MAERTSSSCCSEVEFVVFEHCLDIRGPAQCRPINCRKPMEFIFPQTRRVLEPNHAVWATIEINDINTVDTLEGLGGGGVANVLGLRCKKSK